MFSLLPNSSDDESTSSYSLYSHNNSNSSKRSPILSELMQDGGYAAPMHEALCIAWMDDQPVSHLAMLSFLFVLTIYLEVILKAYQLIGLPARILEFLVCSGWSRICRVIGVEKALEDPYNIDTSDDLHRPKIDWKDVQSSVSSAAAA